MIKTVLKLEKIDKVKPLDDPSVFETVIPPLQRMKEFSDEAFEEFITEWAIACAKPRYKDVYRIGGAGDKGVDVIAEYDNGSFDYYQCKKYSSSLQPSQYWIEFGKLCYYVYDKSISMPQKYYIIASHDLSKKMRALLNNKESIRNGLIEQWDTKCAENLIVGKKIKLDDELLDFIKKFDFNIVDTYSMNTIIEEHRHTHYFYFRFGGNLKPKRNITVLPPNIIENSETKYLTKILQAYSEYRGEEISIAELEGDQELKSDFSGRRQEYYSAESLRRCIRDIFTTDDEFDILKKEMFSGVKDYLKMGFQNGYEKLIKTMHESTKVNLAVSKIDYDLHFVGNDDKKGICHHLANEDQIDWRVFHD